MIKVRGAEQGLAEKQGGEDGWVKIGRAVKVTEAQ